MERIRHREEPNGSSITVYTNVLSKAEKDSVRNEAVRWVAGRDLSEEEVLQISREFDGGLLLQDGILFDFRLDNGNNFVESFRRSGKEGTVIFNGSFESATVIKELLHQAS